MPTHIVRKAKTGRVMVEACVCPPRAGPAATTLAGVVRRLCEPCLHHLLLLRPLARTSGSRGLAAVATAAGAELERRERQRGGSRPHWTEDSGL